MQHPDEGTIHAWIDGALSDAEAAVLEAHARECSACAAAVAEARGLVAGVTRILTALDEAPAGRASASAPAASGSPAVSSALAARTAGGRRRSTWRVLRLTPLRAALAASIMVVAASTLAVRHARMTAVAGPAMDSSAAPLVSQAPPAVAPAPGPPAPAPSVSGPASTGSSRPPAPAEKAAASNPRPAPAAVADAIDAARDRTQTAQDTGSVQRVAQRATDSTDVPPPVVTGAGVNEGRSARMMRSGLAMRRAAPLPSAESAEGIADGGASFAGCYEIFRDSSMLSSPIPVRFALVSGTSASLVGSAKNPVHALTTDGRLGDVIPSAGWRSTGPSTALVTWMNGRAEPALSLQRVGRGIVGRLVLAEGSRPIRVTSLPCSR